VAKSGSQEKVLARHDGEFRASTDEPLSFHDLLALLGSEDPADAQRRNDAIACYLSGGEGWREAMKMLGGAFAEDEPGLRERKAD
jgi:hypothetical protein